MLAKQTFALRISSSHFSAPIFLIAAKKRFFALSQFSFILLSTNSTDTLKEIFHLVDNQSIIAYYQR